MRCRGWALRVFSARSRQEANVAASNCTLEHVSNSFRIAIEIVQVFCGSGQETFDVLPSTWHPYASVILQRLHSASLACMLGRAEVCRRTIESDLACAAVLCIHTPLQRVRLLEPWKLKQASYMAYSLGGNCTPNVSGQRKASTSCNVADKSRLEISTQRGRPLLSADRRTRRLVAEDTLDLLEDCERIWPFDERHSRSFVRRLAIMYALERMQVQVKVRSALVAWDRARG